jgi:hypothetical protein
MLARRRPLGYNDNNKIVHEESVQSQAAPGPSACRVIVRGQATATQTTQTTRGQGRQNRG